MHKPNGNQTTKVLFQKNPTSEVMSYLEPEKIMEFAHQTSKNTRSNLVKNYEGRKEAEQFKKQNIAQKTRENAQARGINF